MLADLKQTIARSTINSNFEIVDVQETRLVLGGGRVNQCGIASYAHTQTAPADGYLGKTPHAQEKSRILLHEIVISLFN